jgi:hypothetical protein
LVGTIDVKKRSVDHGVELSRSIWAAARICHAQLSLPKLDPLTRRQRRIRSCSAHDCNLVPVRPAVCASLKDMPFEGCFKLNPTGDQSFRGSLLGLDIAYCVFTVASEKSESCVSMV